MTNRLFIVHGWGGHPNEAWMPWLDRELTARGFAVHRLTMPHTDEPVIEEWVRTLADAVGVADELTHFVGHSIGVPTILHYLQSLPDETRVGTVVSVAGWFTLTNLEPEEEPIAEPWLTRPLETERIRKMTAHHLALFSDDDEVVPPENAELFERRLGAQAMILSGKGHFSDDSGVTELPEALEFLVRNTQER